MGAATEIDWTGLSAVEDPIAPLTAETFVARLDQLSAAVNALDRLERAFVEQNPQYAHRLPESARTPF